MMLLPYYVGFVLWCVLSPVVECAYSDSLIATVCVCIVMIRYNAKKVCDKMSSFSSLFSIFL